MLPPSAMKLLSARPMKGSTLNLYIRLQHTAAFVYLKYIPSIEFLHSAYVTGPTRPTPSGIQFGGHTNKDAKERPQPLASIASAPFEARGSEVYTDSSYWPISLLHILCSIHCIL